MQPPRGLYMPIMIGFVAFQEAGMIVAVGPPQPDVLILYQPEN